MTADNRLIIDINKRFIPKICAEDNRILRNVFTIFNSSQDIIRELGKYTDYSEFKQKFENKEKIKVDKKTAEKLRFKLTSRVFVDLLNSGWQISLSRKGFLINNGRQNYNFANRDEEKAAQRKSHLNSRNKVIGSKPVQAFIKSMETKRDFKSHKYSILDLIDDGADLNNALKLCKVERQSFETVIKTEIVPIFPEDKTRFSNKAKRCNITNLKYKDIWRYFRLTWATEYTSRPAREFGFLIRNAARKNKPIMGIAMLSSSAIGHTIRDKMIGWDSEESLREHIISKKVDVKIVAQTMLKVLDDSINEIYKKDFKFLYKKLITRPDKEIIKLLVTESEVSGNQRIEDLKAEIDDNIDPKFKNSSTDYKNITLTPLFRKKRAASLAKLLHIRRLFNEVDLEKKPARGYARLRHPTCRGGKQAISLALGKIKEQRNNINIMELSTCGGIAPYSTLLSGKLTTLLMASKEIRDAVKQRYSSQVVVIRSKLAGKEIKSPPVILKAITTTSLYGASSQYNRLKLKSGKYKDHRDEEIANLKTPIYWNTLKGEEGLSEGVGTYHFSAATSLLAHIVSIVEEGYRTVNSIMGEGTSPKLRNLRKVISSIIDADHPSNTITGEDFMAHGMKRKNYICLIEEKILDSIIREKKNTNNLLNTADSITNAWISRWLINRTKTKGDTIQTFKAQQISEELRSHKLNEAIKKTQQLELI